MACFPACPLTVGDRFPAARHDAVAQLDDLGDADNLLGVVTFVRQQHQEEKDVWDDGFRIPEQEEQWLDRLTDSEFQRRRRKKKREKPELAHFNIFKLLQDKAYENLKHRKKMVALWKTMMEVEDTSMKKNKLSLT